MRKMLIALLILTGFASVAFAGWPGSGRAYRPSGSSACNHSLKFNQACNSMYLGKLL